MKATRLQLAINGEKLGSIEKSANRKISFQYDSHWITAHPFLPISRMFPVQEDLFRGDEVNAYLTNLLPDSENVLSRLAAIHGLKTTDAFDLLGVIGKDCVGALQFLTNDEKITPQPLQKEPISLSEIAEILRQLKTQPLGQHGDEEYFRISIAGAQEKTALLKLNGKWFKPIDATPTTHILKPQVDLNFDGTVIPITAENEWLCLKICGLFGLPVAQASIEKFEDVKVLSVERFDRRWNASRSNFDRIIQEDLCQATGTPPHLKYENKGGPGMKQVLEVLAEGENARLDRYQFFKSQIVFWLLAAIDGHAKNFSIQWSDQGLSLAPLYDVISADPFIATGKLSEHKIGLAMAVQGKSRHYKIREILKRHWEETARLAKLPEADVYKAFEEIIQTGRELRTQLSEILPKKFPAETLEPILMGVEKRLKRLE